MPFIDARISKKLTDEQKDLLKTGLGGIMSLIGKPESYTMICIQDGCTLYFGGKRAEEGAYLAVDILGSKNPDNSAKFTAAACRILSEQFGIPGNNVYVEYRHTPDWGWNGGNF